MAILPEPFMFPSRVEGIAVPFLQMFRVRVLRIRIAKVQSVENFPDPDLGLLKVVNLVRTMQLNGYQNINININP